MHYCFLGAADQPPSLMRPRPSPPAPRPARPQRPRAGSDDNDDDWGPSPNVQPQRPRAGSDDSVAVQSKQMPRLIVKLRDVMAPSFAWQSDADRTSSLSVRPQQPRAGSADSDADWTPSLSVRPVQRRGARPTGRRGAVRSRDKLRPPVKKVATEETEATTAEVSGGFTIPV